MESIGDVLRRERLRRGLELEEIATVTKIGQYYLEAMEDNLFDRLPGGLYTRNFVRQYGRALGLPEQELTAAVKEFEAAPLPDPPPPSKLEYFRQIPMYIWLFVAVFGCGGIYEVWKDLHQPPIEHRADVPATIAVTKPSISHPSDSQIARVTPAIQQFSGGNDLAAPDKLLGEPTHTMRIVFAATEPVWLSIKADGVPVYTGTLDEEECKEIEVTGKVNVLVGNAGGLVLSMNGSPVALKGAHGEVQSLVLTTSGVQVIPRIVPISPPIPSKEFSLSE